MNAVTITQITPSELETLIEGTLKKILSNNRINKQSEVEDDLLSVKQAANFLQLKPQTLSGIVQHIDTTGIPVCKKGKRLYFSRKALTTWVMSGKKKTAEDIESSADRKLVN